MKTINLEIFSGNELELLDVVANRVWGQVESVYEATVIGRFLDRKGKNLSLYEDDMEMVYILFEVDYDETGDETEKVTIKKLLDLIRED